MGEVERGAPPVANRADVGNAIELHYHDLGSGPTVIFIHGSGPGASGYSNFKLNYPEFVKAGYRVIVPDLIGYGYSSKPTDQPYSLDLFADTLKGLIDHLGITSCVLVGNSLGGAIALKLAVDFPGLVKGMIMMAPGGIEELPDYFAMPGIQKMMSDFSSGALDFNGMKGLLQLLVHNPKHVTDELVAERLAIVETQPREVLSTMQIPNRADRIPGVKCPVLGFWGMDDQFCPASGAQRYLDNCETVRFTLINKCGHWVMVEYAGLFNRASVEFLQELDLA
ncbi:alpha/beta fold hydrolase [Emcibacter nanhaiensis]|uniref:Alpha/beta fold hydrolase n=1 Tax=Emcibacter nanhaiensis TaxID=1505037 RepID=A0A501PJS4_9PROT|nr:alpha/beta fold hydrolase [Emcibacter nanhaiensis]TPD60709.1 alpha/beta fold hydrolase [Emcibacter nanhaiensis]